MEELHSTPIEKWTEDMVSVWLASIGVKENYIKTLHEQEVDGQVLLKITEEFLKKETGMKSGPALLVIESRNELVKTQKPQKQQNNAHKRTAKSTDQGASFIQDLPISSNSQKEEQMKQDAVAITRKRDSKPRPFGKPGIDYTYVKHEVLPPETGVFDLTTPCHEYKSFNTAATLDRQRLQAKLACEVLKFATGCMNMRSNGTIHFGVMDSRGASGYAHGEIIGIPIREKDMYTDALDYIERCFKSYSELVRQCIRPPEFIMVIEPNRKEQHYVVEFDVEPSLSLVRNKVFSVTLPKFKEKANKTEFEKQTTYHRVGAKTEPVDNINRFYEGVVSRDTQREAAEKSQSFTSPEPCEDLGRKLTMLITGGKKQIEKEKWYILVTNKFSEEDLQHIDFLLNMKLFCVFDFDPDSMVSGLCHEYDQHHAVNLHFMQNYKIPSDKSIKEFEGHLHLFEQTSWIFCNGRNDFSGNETPCDENTWCKTRRTFLKDCVSLICKDFLPKGTFLVIFLLTSPVETPLLKTFDEFFTDMQGHEDIICISESEGNFQKWQTFALEFCDEETVNRSCVVGLKMSHIDAIVQQVQSPSTRVNKLLPVSAKANCHLLTRSEETMYSLEILCVNQCEDSALDTESKKVEIERDFYRGGKVTWENFWLAEKKYVGEMIQRDAYHEVINLLEDSLKCSSDQMPVKCINIYHQPGSGGSTVARQVLWRYRKDRRCAVVNPSYAVNKVSQHAVMLREYEEKDPQKCLTVLLLVEDCDNEYIEELRNELETAVNTKKIAHGIPCFILLRCRRSHNPEKMSRDSPLLNVSVTHKLSQEEKRQFAGKREKLEQQFEPEFILTFVLMSEEFEDEYVKKFVRNLLEDIDHASAVTQLIRYVALLNTYVENSFISQSHCEALLSLQLSICGDRFRQHAFESSLSEQAKLVFIYLRDERTHINSIRIIHQVVAKEILHQLLGDKQQSELALELLSNDLLFNHRFGGEEYRKFLRELFIRRYKISRGDKSDTFFSPLIEHVRQTEKPENAINLLSEAYNRFNKDAYFAQQLARLFYFHEKFEKAEQWAETAANKLPKNSYILDTRGQVYRRWFATKWKAMEKSPKTPESTADAIETAFKAIECFQKCQTVAVEETETMNNSGFFGVVEVGCGLLELISSLDVFSNKPRGHSELQKYLLTEHIPKEIEVPWKHFHDKLKSLQPTMNKALEWVSEELSYFQKNLDTDEEETFKTSELTIHRPKHWLVAKSSVYGRFFCEVSLSNTASNWQSNLDKMTDFSKRMAIYQLSGGNFTTIFSILDQKNKNQVTTLENIISLHPKGAKMDKADLINYIASHFALSAISPGSPKLAPFKDLQKLSRSFLQDKLKCPSNALFLCTLLFWPEDHDTDQDKEDKYKTILTAVKFLQQTYKTKMKDILPRKRRIFTHFFLGNGHGYYKFVHKSRIRNFPSVSEKRLKWVEGEMFKIPEIERELKRVNGWTEDGSVYLEGPKMEKFSIHPLNESSLPAGNENVTFYLGFTFRGPVACGITIRKQSKVK
ncbi:sterile alpha motif domain-containing protein 9-like [Pangasianodon hypophthalmus]|uniref:sterile alpha motif domain-containing protein 9-like n=1 Tax=Pangasianodon hypophthalmus TaxID=310915 RepID=UPI000F003CD8|nr:sterile alpha motif domain-containing protein 9-like [Pangasianodon hypophthalmus]